ncbi:MAG: hypothetical protein ACLGSA_05750 [Acidobacteriota bacterium]
MRAFMMFLAMLMAASPAFAVPAKKTQKKAKAKTPEACQPIDVSAGEKPCYRFQGKGPYGRCEPQSLPYGRCRTGIKRCQGNCETSPIGWFKCEEKLGKTSARPMGESILILGDNSRHRMTTGHVFVVEKTRDLGGGHWELTLSHTNYDRRCAIETNVLASYDEKAQLLAMKTGHWSAWGKNLKALGFILK